MGYINTRVMVLGLVFEAPDLFQQLLKGEDLTSVTDEGRQQLEFRWRQACFLAANPDSAGVNIDHQVIIGVNKRLAAIIVGELGTAQQGFNSCMELDVAD